jgi:hypothetical protein
VPHPSVHVLLAAMAVMLMLARTLAPCVAGKMTTVLYLRCEVLGDNVVALELTIMVHPIGKSEIQ